MSNAAVMSLGMSIVLAALLMGLALAAGYGLVTAIAIYAFGGSGCLLLTAFSAFAQQIVLRDY